MPIYQIGFKEYTYIYKVFDDVCNFEEYVALFSKLQTCTEMVFCYQNCAEPTVRNNCSSDREKLLKFEAEGREFAKFLRSLEQFIQTVKGQKNFW